MGAVQALAQGTVLRMRHHRVVTGVVQRQAVAAGRARGQLHVLRHAGHLGLAGQVVETVGGVEHVLAVALLQFGRTFLDLREAFARRALQFGTAKHELAQRVLQRLLLRRRQRGVRGGDVPVLGIQRGFGTQPGVEVGDARQGVVVSLAQLRRVAHLAQVRHRAPGAAQALDRHVQQQRQAGVVGRPVGRCGARQGRVGVGQQHIHRRRHVAGFDAVIGRQSQRLQQGVGVVAGRARQGIQPGFSAPCVRRLRRC